MNILVLGATGRIGSLVVSHALKDGHRVTALARNIDKVNITHENLKVIQGNVLSKADLGLAMSDIDAIISALSTDGTTTLSESIILITDIMKIKGIKRIITVGTAGILQSRNDPSLLRYQSKESRHKSTRATEEHHKVYSFLSQSSLEWTIVCPTYLTVSDSIATYRIEPNFLPIDGVKISIHATAQFTYHQLICRKYLNSRVGIAY